jgi:hypothetical protein
LPSACSETTLAVEHEPLADTADVAAAFPHAASAAARRAKRRGILHPLRSFAILLLEPTTSDPPESRVTATGYRPPADATFAFSVTMAGEALERCE